MKRFDDNELEIAVLTRNRGEILRKFFEKQIDEIREVNASFVIYDTSSNDDTEELVGEYQNKGYNIKYRRDDFEKSIDEKYLDAIINSTAKYIWIMGDSNYMAISLFSEKSYEYIKNDYQLLVVYGNVVRDKENKEYHNVSDVYADCLWHLTWMGGPVVRRDVYDKLVNEKTKNQIINDANTTKGSWYSSIGVLYDSLLLIGDINARVVTVPFYGLATVEKKQAWVSTAYKTWCKDLCLLVDSFGKSFEKNEDRALKTTWKRLELDGGYWSTRFRVENGLNRDIFDDYNRNGYIARCSEKVKSIKRWAYRPITLVKFAYELYKIKEEITRVVIDLCNRLGIRKNK